MKAFKVLVATAMLGLALAGRADAASAFEAPYADMHHSGSCLNWSEVLPTPSCASSASADSDSGRVLLDASLPEGAATPMQAASVATGGVRIPYTLTEATASIPFTVVAHVNSAHARIAATIPGGVNSASAVSLAAQLSYGFGTPLGGAGSAAVSTSYSIVTTNPLFGVPDVADLQIEFNGSFDRTSGQFSPGNYELFFGPSGGISCGLVVPDLCSGGATADVVIERISIG
jgi:hypothetical protein